MSSYQDDSSEEKLINSGSYHEAAKLIKNIKDAQKRYRLMKKLMEVLLPKYNDALRYVYFDEEGIIEDLGLVEQQRLHIL